MTIALVPDGVSRVTVASDLPLPADAISGALDEAGGYQVVVVGQELTGESGAPDGAKHRR